MSSNPTQLRKVAWQWILQRKYFSKAELINAVGFKPTTAGSFIQFLIKHKRLIAIVASKGRKRSLYKLIDDSPLQFGSGARVNNANKSRSQKLTGRRRCWNAMRVLRRFTVAEIAQGGEVAYSSAGLYIRKLVQSGYLRCIQSPNEDISFATYTLIRNSGSLNPVVTKEGVRDQNTGNFFEFKRVKPALKSKAIKEKSYA